MSLVLPPHHSSTGYSLSKSKFSCTPSTKSMLYFFLPSFLSILFSFLLPSHIQPKSPVIISASPRLSFLSIGALNREISPCRSPVTHIISYILLPFLLSLLTLSVYSSLSALCRFAVKKHLPLRNGGNRKIRYTPTAGLGVPL